MVGIAYRLSTLKNADQIYSVDDGEIIEPGRHEELIDGRAVRGIARDSITRWVTRYEPTVIGRELLVNRCAVSKMSLGALSTSLRQVYF